MLAVMRDAVVRRPQPAHHFKAFFENALVVVERDVERLIFAAVITAAAGEIDAAPGQQIERRPLLGDADRMMQRQNGDRGREPDARGVGGDISQHHVWAGQHAERVEVMFADPGRMHAESVGIKRLGGDVGDELVRITRVVFVVIVAQREIAEFHRNLPPLCICQPLLAVIIVDNTSVVNALIFGYSVATMAPAKPRSRLDLGDYVPYLANRVGMIIAEQFGEEALASHGLSIAMWRVMAVLAANGSQRQIDIVDKTSIEASTLSRLVSRLVRMGFVARSRSANSNREVAVELSAKGSTLVARLIPMARQYETDAIAGLSSRELTLLKSS